METQKQSETTDRRRLVVIGIALFLAIVLVFGDTVRHDFVNFDDEVYVTENPRVLTGLTMTNLVWAFTHSHAGNWHPITTISHLLDCQIYGLNAGGHHLTNVLWHALTAVLLFLLLFRMMGEIWPSAFVAFLFAVHPLRVESVAWVSERKDVLSGFFFVVILWAYRAYATKRFSAARYGRVMLLFALGLMTKQMLVTLPLVMLLLDYWPLGRWESPSGTKKSRTRLSEAPKVSVATLVLEKIPLLLLSGAGSWIIFQIQRAGNVPLDAHTLGSRLANAVVAYVAYIGKLFFPYPLAVLYPYSETSLTIGRVVPALAVLVCLSWSAVNWRRKYPYLLVGWFWYLIMLVPVIGIVQIGAHSIADRYTYLPEIGLVIALVWAVRDLARAWAPGARVAVFAGGAIVVVLAVVAVKQTTYWRNSETLFQHAIESTTENDIAHSLLGVALAKAGRNEEAITQYEAALEINPRSSDAHNSLGVVLLRQGRTEEAITQYHRALEIAPNDEKTLVNMGQALEREGKVAEAVPFYERAVRSNPLYVNGEIALGNVKAVQGHFDDAVAWYRKALDVNPGSSTAKLALDTLLAKNGKSSDAIVDYERALATNPRNVEAHINLGSLLATRGRVDEAIAQFQKALEISPGNAVARENLEKARKLASEMAAVPKGTVASAPAEGKSTPRHADFEAPAETRETPPLQKLDLGASGGPSVEEMQRVAISAPTADNLFNLALALYRAKQDLPRVEKLLRQAESLGASSGDLYLLLGWVLFDRNEDSPAQEAFLKATAHTSNPSAAWIGAAGAAGRSGHWTDSLEFVQKGLAINPNDPAGLETLGNIRFSQGDPAAAATAWGKSLELKPDNDRLRGNLQIARKAMEARNHAN